MDKLKEIIGNVVMGHCDGGYIENTTDFINDLTNSIKSNQLGNPKKSEQTAKMTPQQFLDYLDSCNEGMPVTYLDKLDKSDMYSEETLKWMLGKYLEINSNISA